MIGMGTVINSAFVLAGGLLGFLFGKALVVDDLPFR